MAKHIAKDRAKTIGSERVSVLTALSVEAAKRGNTERARRYVGLSRAICGKTRTDMPDGFRYCKKCLSPLVPGTNCTVRLTGHKIVSRCACGEVWRMPYLRERKK